MPDPKKRSSSSQTDEIKSDLDKRDLADPAQKRRKAVANTAGSDEITPARGQMISASPDVISADSDSLVDAAAKISIPYSFISTKNTKVFGNSKGGFAKPTGRRLYRQYLNLADNAKKRANATQAE